MRPQFYVRTKSHEWQYDIEEREGFKCKEVGIISRHDFQERVSAIAKGEWKPRGGEPLCWFSPMEDE
jgi:hypothetical protein